MRTILLPVAVDPPPFAAARRAAWLARRSGARIVLLHVAAAPGDSAAWEGLQQAVMPLCQGVTVQPLRRYGPAASQILAAARDEGAEMVVMTRHERWRGASERGFPRFLLHSVLYRVVREAGCPVWVETEDAPGAIGLVLCAIASFTHDRDTLRRAEAVAALVGARLGLFRNAVSAATAMPGRSRRLESWQQDVVAATRADLETLRDLSAARPELHVGIGDFSNALVESAQEARAGLIVLRRTSRDWGTDETLAPVLRATRVSTLVSPGSGEPAYRPALRGVPRRPRARRLVAPLLLAMVLGFGVWLMHRAFVVVTHPDVCADYAYGCAFEQGWKKTKGERIKEPADVVHPQR